MPAAVCLSDELVLELVHGHLADDQLGSVQQHLAACADCRTLVAETAAADPQDPDVATEPARADDAAPLAKGARVGRYEVEELIGAGGIGLVYAARDPELHRRVALKIMRSSALPIGPAGDVGARMLREARAMAQLSHPNVVTVYDVGTYDDRVFLAMELVAGATLRRWLKARPRVLAEILDVFRAAGDGVAAAHRIGLVHRDFKPENVLVGDDGRVRVTDFGLARPVDWEGTGSHRALDGNAWTNATLTRTGVFAGTPAYMAPEQYAGEAPDPRSDQFGFCVALYEAIYGERPFGGATVDEIIASIRTGAMREPPDRTDVPSGLVSVILRGLRREPGERFASMAALLDALSVALDPPTSVAIVKPPRRRMVAAIAGAAVIAAAAVVLVQLQRSEPAAALERPAPAHPVVQPPPPVATEMPKPEPVATEAPKPALVVTEAPKPALVVTEAPKVVPKPPPVVKPRVADLAKPQKPVKRTVAKPVPPAKPVTPARVGDGLKDPF